MPAAPPAPLSARAISHAAGTTVERHSHPWGQLCVVTHGTMTIVADQGWWLVPPGRAIWVAAGIDHSARYSEASALIQLLLAPALTVALPGSGCRTLTASSLVRELALEAARLQSQAGQAHAAPDQALALIARLLVLQLAGAAEGPLLFVPHGHDRRLRRVTDRLRQEPGLTAPLAQLAHDAGCSPRTLARLFVAETGLSFGRWREHLRIVAAVDRLSRGHSITATALDLGYQSPSAFTTMFSRILGLPPGRYLRQLQP